MPYTLMTAATACGINRSTVLRSIKAGRISATKDGVTGAWLIEPAELHRLYPPVVVPDANAVAVPKDATPDATTNALVAGLARPACRDAAAA
jgi:excisionase family DNA binding protein